MLFFFFTRRDFDEKIWNDLASGSTISGVLDSYVVWCNIYIYIFIRQGRSRNDVLLNEQPDINLGNNRFKRRWDSAGGRGVTRGRPEGKRNESVSNIRVGIILYPIPRAVHSWFIGFAAISSLCFIYLRAQNHEINSTSNTCCKADIIRVIGQMHLTVLSYKYM